MPNLWSQFAALLPQAPLLVGDVVDADDSGATVELPDGSKVRARGDADVGARVFLRDGVIEGPAPDLAVIEIEI
ncbi:hypothetical protein [Niveibacterium sp. SC-1]|uniref:hypothetical protein n=1 Tax=Niveibacterium sp. SC-1 TaxID=3135646 RepID=UPI00311F9C96